MMKPALLMGLLCAAGGLLAGALVALTAGGSGYGWFVLAAPAAAFLCGAGLWQALVAWPGRTSLKAAALTGALAALLATFLCWYLLLLGAWGCYMLTGGCTGSLGDAPVNPLEALVGAGIYGGLSLLILGWFTVPGGAAAGVYVAWRQRKLAAAADAQPQG